MSSVHCSSSDSVVEDIAENLAAMQAPLSTGVRMSAQDKNFMYFCENSCEKSISVCIGNSESISEQEVAEFVRYAKPTLYEKLRGMRITSSHVPSDDDQQDSSDVFDNSDLDVEDGKEMIDVHAVEKDLRQAIKEQFAAMHSGTATEFDRKIDSSDIDCPSQIDTTWNMDPKSYQLRLPEAEKPVFLADRYRLTFTRHNEPGKTYCCASPTCQYLQNVIPEEDLFAILYDEACSEGIKTLTDDEKTSYYCLDCLPEVVDRECGVGTAQKILPHVLDGAGPDRKTIMEKAEKIHPPLKKKDLLAVHFPLRGEPVFEPGVESNSKNAIDRRRQKQYEVDRIVEELKQRELTIKARAEINMDEDVDELSLKTVPPFDLEPYREQYKKQGRQWVDRLEGLQITARRRAVAQLKAQQVPRQVLRGDSVQCGQPEDVFFCHCRQPVDQEGMVRCSSASCMFGWVHLRCSGLKQMPKKNEEYLCVFCKDFTGGRGQGDGAKLKECISEIENDLDLSNTGLGDKDCSGLGEMIGGREKGEVPIVTHGFVAVNKVRTKTEDPPKTPSGSA